MCFILSSSLFLPYIPVGMMKVMLTSDGGVVGNWVVVVEAGMVTLVVVVFVVVMVGVVVVVKGGEGLAGGRGEDIGTSTASSAVNKGDIRMKLSLLVEDVSCWGRVQRKIITKHMDRLFAHRLI